MWQYVFVLFASNPGIQIVTAGTDWAAIAATIATTVAAVLGIAGTAWQAKRGREATSADLRERLGAENNRGLVVEKRRVYSEFQGRMDDVFVAAVQLYDRKTGRADLRDALGAMYRATAAVKLVATPEIGALANKIAQTAADETATKKVGTREFDRDNRIYDGRQRLYQLMRMDVGLDGAPEPDPPELPRGRRRLQWRRS
jgi:hypothetical protein